MALPSNITLKYDLYLICYNKRKNYKNEVVKIQYFPHRKFIASFINIKAKIKRMNGMKTKSISQKL